MTTVHIVDSGICNLGSIHKALVRGGADVEISTMGSEIRHASHVVLPGVGSFPAGMQALQDRGFAETLPQVVDNGAWVLGICLGMQLLFSEGFEFKKSNGLGLVAGKVRAIEATPNPVPHMGWNKVIPRKESPLFDDVTQQPWLYFVHSYVCEPSDGSTVIGETEYGESFCSAIQSNRVFGVQAHPEKSQQAGASILKNFINLGDQDA
ncbi:imidazole glycerol phosphate synthase subunit HisH [Planctomycetota bacterium]|nr:imidazole glycerol phosphate synthase subunit HisH [Planctomycetota bacterium]